MAGLEYTGCDNECNQPHQTDEWVLKIFRTVLVGS